MAVLATAVWRVRPSGSNTNGGGYDPGISGAATDYSQQNAAQATGTHGTATGTTTFTDTVAANFTAAMIGNALWIASGAGFTTGPYFITAFGSSTSVTLDRSPGTGTVAVWALGGGWADFWTNTTSSGSLVGNNVVYILGSGTPNPAAYTYDYDATTSFTPFGTNNTLATFANDPATPGYKAPPDTTGGMPVIKFHVANTIFNVASTILALNGLWFVGTTTAATFLAVTNGQFDVTLLGCVLDQFSFDCGLLLVNQGGTSVVGCEIFSSVAPGGAGSNSGIKVNNTAGIGVFVSGCNVHDCVGLGITNVGNESYIVVINTIMAKCQSDGLNLSNFGGTFIQNCTIDGNLGNGITLAAAVQVYSTIFNNIISNQTGVGKFGIKAASAVSPLFIDYNVYYNNTADLSNLSYGPHDTHGGSNPYVAQSTENYTLA